MVEVGGGGGRGDDCRGLKITNSLHMSLDSIRRWWVKKGKRKRDGEKINLKNHKFT